MKAVLISGYLPKEVTDRKHKSARETATFLRGIIKNAGGATKKLEVLSGTLFISLKDETGLKELKEALSGLEGVKVEEPSQAMLIFIKERARNEAQLSDKKAA